MDIPPFPEYVDTLDLPAIDYEKLKSRDPEEEARMFDACIDLGFFRLTKPPIDPGPMFQLAKEVFDETDKEKSKYDMGSSGNYFGYRTIGEVILPNGQKTYRTEHFNISRDVILNSGSNLEAVKVGEDILMPLAKTIGSQKEFTIRSHDVALLILEVLESKLGLPRFALVNLHKRSSASGDQIRLTKSRGKTNQHEEQSASANNTDLSLGAHTDFGSVTILFNRLGGLQVLRPDLRTWGYVVPYPEHAIVNLGDALVRLTGGVLRSSIHRVIDAPGKQAQLDRYSIVNFVRPANEVYLDPIKNSTMDRLLQSGRCAGNMSGIVGGLNGDNDIQGQRNEDRMTAQEWIAMKARESKKWHSNLISLQV